MATIEIQVPRTYKDEVVTQLQSRLSKSLDGHKVQVVHADDTDEFIALVYAQMGLKPGFLNAFSEAIETVLSSTDFSLQVSTNLVQNPIQYLRGSWRM